MQIPRLYSSLAKYYDRLEGQYRDYGLESSWLASLIKTERSKKILDISCGTGRHAAGLLNELGKSAIAEIQMVAMDASGQMVKISKCATEGQTKPEIVQGDFLGPPFKDNSFDFVICMYWSLAHLNLQSVRKLFRAIASILIHNGVLVFDVENAEGIKENLLGRPFVDAFFFDEKEQCTVIRTNLSKKIEADLVDWGAYYILDWGSLSRLITDKMQLRFYKKSALESILAEENFEVQAVSSSPFGKYEENSPSLYFVGRLRGKSS